MNAEERIRAASNGFGMSGPGWNIICPTCLGAREACPTIRRCECVVNYFFMSGEKHVGEPHGWDDKGRPYAYHPLKPGRRPVKQALYSAGDLSRVRRRITCRRAL